MTISPYSSFSYPIQGDTLFGAFCWSYKYLYGTEKLEQFLYDCVKGKPKIIFSNMFLKDMLPIPFVVLNKIKNMDKNCDLDYFKKMKKINKQHFLPKEIFLETLENNYENVLDKLVTLDIESELELHNMVDRETLNVNNKNGDGNLYAINTYYSKRDFDIYILCECDIKEYMNVLELMFELGIGSRKSTGKGSFKIVCKPCVEESLIRNLDKANGYMALSNFIPKKYDSTNGYYDLISKFPKLDREFSNSKTPFKKPVMMVEAGSCFYYKVKTDYCGTCLDNISPLNRKIIINACSIAIPMCLDENNSK